jgi:hypothetical protein
VENRSANGVLPRFVHIRRKNVSVISNYAVDDGLLYESAARTALWSGVG